MDKIVKAIKSEEKANNAYLFRYFLLAVLVYLKNQRGFSHKCKKRTTKTILILLVYIPAVFSKPTSLISSV